MFISLRYCNTEKLNEYTAIVNGKKRLNVNAVSVSSEKGISFNIPIAGAILNGKTTIDANMEDSILFDYDSFEKSLKDSDYFFDCIEDNLDLTTVPNSSIIKFQSNLFIPDEFDAIQMMEQFKPFLLEQASYQMETNAYNFLESSMKKDDIRIPVKVEVDNVIIHGKISSKYLLIDYTELEDFESEEVVVLAKVLSHKKGEVIIYDPLKDFIRLSRAMRRTGDMKSLPNQLDKIYVDGDSLSIEIIAIYQ